MSGTFEVVVVTPWDSAGCAGCGDRGAAAFGECVRSDHDPKVNVSSMRASENIYIYIYRAHLIEHTSSFPPGFGGSASHSTEPSQPVTIM